MAGATVGSYLWGTDKRGSYGCAFHLVKDENNIIVLAVANEREHLVKEKATVFQGSCPTSPRNERESVERESG